MSQYFLSHPANTSTAGCLEEDQVFIRNAHEGNMTLVKSSTRSEVPYRVEGGARVALVWAAVEHLRLDLAISVFSRVLEGNHHEDLWFWRHGDEELTGAATLRSSPPWKEAANALQIRSSRQQAQTKLEQLELKQLVQSAAPELRVAMIYWLVMTSQAYKTATRKPGRRDEEEGGVLGGVRALVTRWWSSLPDGVQKWLSEHSQDYDRRAFDAGMVAKGHNCHVDDPEQHGFASDDPTRALRTWLFMRSRLYPLRKDNIFCLGYRRRWSSDKSDICPVYLSSALEPLPPWTPAPAVVALRHIWDRVADGRDFSKWIAIQDMSGFQEVENFIYRISSDFPSLEFRPWVNTYPQDIREAAASYTLEEWRTVAACVPLYPAATTIDKKKRFGTSVLKKITSALHPKLIFDIRACFAAMVWKMMLANMSTMEHVRKFVDIMGSFELIPRHTNHALETVCTSFYSEIKKLHHTCWSYNRIAEYASVMMFMGQEVPEVVGIDVDGAWGCPICGIQ
ncbi:hypothetical protein BT96DRAFT_143697 [Gymnopus androsaceus JB14]|uniref:Uncharacterized protein n=1 Tax=Gymnopus androsaceus JB14 TaxID=1447944 RepID=A0A6A4HCT5_9AGAR|nr:hypothetical protein BT96DRAFT_143697 [Gymnopus androsaceus JB14]